MPSNIKQPTPDAGALIRRPNAARAVKQLILRKAIERVLSMFNSNFVHNIINVAGWVLGLVTGILTVSGCKFVELTQTYDCTTSMIPPTWLPFILGGGYLLKQVINVGRDGLGGLWKVQPPVVDATATVTTPIMAPTKADATKIAEAVAAKK